MRKETLSLSTRSRTEFVPVSRLVQKTLQRWGVQDGICTIYVPHTTAGIFINEGYDPDVMRDMEMMLDKVIPWSAGYRHSEGNAAAHIKAALIGNSRQVIVEKGELVLGQWEEIFFAEFDGPRSRRMIVALMGEEKG